jgi:hypothetical protein
MTTKTIITTSGWYENDDGTITEYTWNEGQLHEMSTVADWAAVGALKAEREREVIEDLTKEYCPRNRPRL